MYECCCFGRKYFKSLFSVMLVRSFVQNDQKKVRENDEKEKGIKTTAQRYPLNE